MSPTLSDGDIAVFHHGTVTAGSVVLARVGGRDVVKRVKTVENDTVYIVGDNRDESTDSRHYGVVKKSDIVGVMKFILPTAASPPKLVKPYGVWLGRIAAFVLVFFALLHLFRIDSFIPLLDENLPGGTGWATTAAIGVILTEIFALPFLFRMKLSPLAHLLSGTLAAFAPLWWWLLAIWAFGSADTTGQLGEFYPVYATVPVLAFNLVWLVFNYITIYTLGYNRLTFSGALKKKK